MGQEFWRFPTRNSDGVIQSNSTSKVPPSTEVIAAEVLRQQKQHRIEQHGTGVIRENWLQHNREADIARDAGLAYREIEAGLRQLEGAQILPHIVTYGTSEQHMENYTPV